MLTHGIWPKMFQRQNAEGGKFILEKRESIMLTSMIPEEQWLVPACNKKEKKRKKNVQYHFATVKYHIQILPFQIFS